MNRPRRRKLAGMRCRHTASGHVEIRSKEDAKNRGRQPPDLCLASRVQARVVSMKAFSWK
jgi:hypothetical protein